MAPTVETAAAISQDCDEYASQHKKLKRGRVTWHNFPATHPTSVSLSLRSAAISVE
jgi:hypothetical protein